MEFDRLSDLIAGSIDRDKIQSIIQMVADTTDMEKEDQAASLVISGAALGVDEVMARIKNHENEHRDFLIDVIAKIDEMLDQSPSLEVSQVLATVRGMAALRLSKIQELIKQEFAARTYIGLGIGAELIFSDTQPTDYARLDLVGIGSEVYRRTPESVLGWHYGRTQGLPPDFKCHCPSCYARLFNHSSISEEVGLRQMVTDSQGMDNALAEYAVYILEYLRKDFVEMQSKTPSLHNIDPTESSNQLKDLLSRMKGDGS